MITREQIDNAVACLKQHVYKPEVVKDQAEADAMNAYELETYALVGLKPVHIWKIGDEYYKLT